MSKLKLGDKLIVEGELRQTCDDEGRRGAILGDYADPQLEMSRQVYDWIDDTVTRYDYIDKPQRVKARITIEVIALEPE